MNIKTIFIDDKETLGNQQLAGLKKHLVAIDGISLIESEKGYSFTLNDNLRYFSYFTLEISNNDNDESIKKKLESFNFDENDTQYLFVIDICLDSSNTATSTRMFNLLREKNVKYILTSGDSNYWFKETTLNKEWIIPRAVYTENEEDKMSDSCGSLNISPFITRYNDSIITDKNYGSYIKDLLISDYMNEQYYGGILLAVELLLNGLEL